MERRWITNWSVRWPPTSGSDSPIYNGTPLLTYPGGGAVTGSLSLSGILRDRQGGVPSRCLINTGTPTDVGWNHDRSENKGMSE